MPDDVRQQRRQRRMTLEEAIRRNDETHDHLIERLTQIENKFRHHQEVLHEHFTNEHGDLEEISNWIRSARMSAKIIGVLAAILTGVAASAAWLIEHVSLRR